MEKNLNYAEIFQRNIGFVTEIEQDTLRKTAVFICGVGGMGGACLMMLVRSGCENLGIADIDEFEASNINRQLFASMDTIGKDKAAASVDQIAHINPSCKVTNYGRDWLEKLDAILSVHKVVVNGTDDLKAGITLYRKAREHGATVIDAYTSSLPSVYVISPSDPRPEERLGYPTVDVPVSQITKEMEQTCKMKEAAYVIAASSTLKHVDFEVAKDVVAGKRPRMSFAPMVIGTGTLMAYQAIAKILKRPYCTDHKGYFVQPWSGAVERQSFLAWHMIKFQLAQSYLKRLLS